MRLAGVAGAHRGRKSIITRADDVIDERPDVVQRDFTAAARCGLVQGGFLGSVAELEVEIAGWVV